jgi:hypothetical protein
MGIPKLLRRRLCWPELLPGYDPPVILAPEQERGALPALEPLTPEGAGGRSALDSIDREATRSANAKTLQSPDLSDLTR